MRKKVEKTVIEPLKEEVITQKINSPLIFISHDTRDAELAEEFSNLLKSASTGALKSFVSSDKKGTRGIEYGLEWYPAIMDKIDEASEVVCLLTQRSVERPWILYEAGVAKGKLGKKVIGIALGIDQKIAFTGPFAQFQNNDGSVTSISKLVLELIRKVPGLDPDQQLVEQLVQNFHNKSLDVLAKSQEQTEGSIEESNENIVAKLFEEVKIMFENLPSRIERRIDPEYRRRKRKIHPMMFDELMHFGMESKNPNLGFLMLISFIKDDLPWMYEIGLETYRSLQTAKTPAAKRKILLSFENATEMIGHPMMSEIFGKSEDMYMFNKDFKHYLHYYIKNYLSDEKTKELFDDES
ncbi:MAG TPA: toll/interleukin-1 receptor domain-containing protein [Saprospiraceae bacterium]|nr:toll/interleukin-1 receptor domain-containing protein [Saprospiraceae bacterium]